MIDTHVLSDWPSVPFNVFWFRRDLRTNDNPGLNQAMKAGLPVVLLFIFDSDILNDLESPSDRRVSLIYDALKRINTTAGKAGSRLHLLHGKPADVFENLTANPNFRDVFANEDYEPYGRKRDQAVSALLARNRKKLHLYQDHILMKPGAVLKDNGEPYTIYTPFQRKWKSILQHGSISPQQQPSFKGLLAEAKPVDLPSLQHFGFTYQDVNDIIWEPNPDLLSSYAQQRDYPGVPGTSMIGPHLRFGTYSIRKAYQAGAAHSETWVNELIWREFFMHILWHYPKVVDHAFKPAYDRIIWRNDPVEFERWKWGQTGFPLVDAGMRQLISTGFMHNRVRMVTASFLTKHLLIDWRWGEAWFARHLLDYELSSNNGNWQWAAGIGCDAAPYFRIFNPLTQQKKFDPKLIYVRQWVPEWGTPKYPKPIVDHDMARKRCLSAYKNALQP